MLLYHYYLPNIRGEGWADVVVGVRPPRKPGGHSCCWLGIVSDYGNYAYQWTGVGEPDGRHFLLGLDRDYLVGKIAPGYETDWDATRRALRTEICRARRRDGLRGEGVRADYRDAYDRLENVNSDLELHEWYDHDYGHFTHLLSWDTIADAIRRRRDQQAVAFYDRCWPRLCGAIRAQLALEDEVEA